MSKSQEPKLQSQNPKPQNGRRFGHVEFGFWISSRGFTLLEMIISLGIFSVVVVAAIGITLAIKLSQQKTTNAQDVQDNIRYALEYMTKELRQGYAYEVFPTGCDTSSNPCTKVKFARAISGTEHTIWYCLVNDVIYRADDSADVCGIPNTTSIPLTSGDVRITKLLFYVVGNLPGPADGQPRITIAMGGNSVDARTQLQSYFRIQTTVTQLKRDGVSVPLPIGFWKFDEGSGTAASDSGTGGHTATLNGAPGPTWVTGQVNNALSFDGSNDRVVIIKARYRIET